MKLSAMVVVASFATLIVTTILGSVGIGFTASGVVVFAIGVLETSGIHLPGGQSSGVLHPLPRPSHEEDAATT